MEDPILQVTATCPRCDGVWVDIIVKDGGITRYQCTRCGMMAQVMPNWGMVAYYIIVGRYDVAWYNVGHCKVTIDGDSEVRFEHHLPFDVTEKQIKLYLTFQ